MGILNRIFSYMYINQTDPDETLTWLISELLDSEVKEEKVHCVILIILYDSMHE